MTDLRQKIMALPVTPKARRVAEAVEREGDKRRKAWKACLVIRDDIVNRRMTI